MSRLNLFVRLMVGLFFLGTGLAPAQDNAPPLTFPPQFSSRVIRTIKGDNHFGSPFGNRMPSESPIKKFRVVVDGGKVRVEEMTDGDPILMIKIYRPDLNLTYNITPSMRHATQEPYRKGFVNLMLGIVPEETRASAEFLGNEELDGTDCLKYGLKLPGGQDGILWMTAAEHIPVKMESADGFMKIVWSDF